MNSFVYMAIIALLAFGVGWWDQRSLLGGVAAVLALVWILNLISLISRVGSGSRQFKRDHPIPLWVEILVFLSAVPLVIATYIEHHKQ
jgi:hypothetical protein